jgi:hypothetical protein
MKKMGHVHKGSKLKVFVKYNKSTTEIKWTEILILPDKVLTSSIKLTRHIANSPSPKDQYISVASLKFIRQKMTKAIGKIIPPPLSVICECALR